jgi:hypothetical protein
MSNTRFQFKTYDRAELNLCSTAFISRFEKDTTKDMRKWTRNIAAWFWDATAPGVSPYGKPKTGEFILDQCHTTLQDPTHPREMTCGQWESACIASARLLLAMECEWGHKVDKDVSLGKILHDAWKLAVVRAKLKVMVFASHDGASDRSRVQNNIAALRRSAGDNSPWLLLDVPWRNTDDSQDVIGVHFLPTRSKGAMKK